MHTIGVLNSYLYPGDQPDASVRIKAFLQGLSSRGFEPGGSVALKIVHSNSQKELLRASRAFVESEVSAIHAIGTPNAAIARQATSRIPIVYYGAHPQGIGLPECSGENICGLQLVLPFTSSYKEFRLIRDLVPKASKLYVPFFDDTVFCHPQMRACYSSWKDMHGASWIPSATKFIGYRGLAGLAEVFDMDYYEFPLSNSAEIDSMMDAVGANGVLMVYNEVFYCPDAPARLLSAAWARRIPVIWNNNAGMARHGALAGLAGCFEEAASVAAELCVRLLQGERPTAIGRLRAQRTTILKS